MICKCHVLAFFLLLSTAVSATSYRWQSSEQDPDGVFTNAVHFSVDPASIRAQDVVFIGDSSGDTIVRIPAGLDYSAPLAPHFQAAEGHSFTLDVRGASWTQPNTDSGNPYSNQGPYRFAVGKATDYYTDRKLCLVNAPTTSGVFKIADGLLSVSNKVGGSDSFEVYFHSGTFDFVEPNGSDAGATGWFTAGGNFRMGFLGGEVRLPNILFYATAGMSEYDFTGGSHYIKKMNIRHWDVAGESDTSPHTLFNVHGSETKLTLGELGFLDYSREHAYRLAVSDGATLEIAGNVQQKAGGISDIVLNDATLALTANSTWTDARLFATNTTVRSAAHNLTFKTSRADFRECALSVGNLYIGNVSGTSCVDVAGGAIDVTGELIIGNGQSVGSLTLSEGASVVAALTYIGSNAGGFGCLAVSNGAELVSKAAATEIGTRGNSFVHIGEGGRFKASALMKFASGGDARGTTNILLQTGGEIDIGTSVNLIGGKNGGDCYVKLELDGGVLKAQSIEGGDGCSAKDTTKTGIAVLSGNGGMLKPTKATSSFIQNLNRAECGAGGLTIDSDYDIAIPQNFSDIYGQTGELILAGKGTKTLSGEANAVSRIVVADGTVSFASGARASSALVLINDASVTFADSMSEIGLTRLVVGSSDSPGKLAYSAASPIELDCAIEMNRVHLKLSGDFTAGNDYVVLSTTGAIADGSAEAWSDALVVSAADMSLSYSFRMDRLGGTTSFVMEVRECALTIDVAEGAELDYEDKIALDRNASALVNVASNATLTLRGDMDAGSLVKRGQGRVVLAGGVVSLSSGIFCDEGIVSVCGVSVLEKVGKLFISDGTFEFVGDGGGSQQTLPCPFVCEPSIPTNIVDLKIEAPLTITNIDLRAGCIFKRGIGTLTFAPADGETMILSRCNGTETHNTGGPAAPYSIGDVTSLYWPHPRTGYTGFNVAEGDVLVRGGTNAVVLLEHRNSIMTGASSIRARPSFAVEGVKASVGTSGYICHGGYWNDSAGPARGMRCPMLVISNGAEVSTGTIKTGQDALYSFATTVVDSATWNVGGSLCPYGATSPWSRSTFIFRNGAKVYVNKIQDYGPSSYCVFDSVLAKNASLDCFPVYAPSQMEKWEVGPNALVAIQGFSVQTNSFAYRSDESKKLRLMFNGGVWKTKPSAWQPLQFWGASNVVIKTVCEAGITFPVEGNDVIYASRAIAGEGGMVKTGDGRFVFCRQATWYGVDEDKDKNQGNWIDVPLEDPVTLAFEGTLDVQGGDVSVESGACRVGGAYNAAYGAAVDFGGNDLGDGVTFSGGGRFSNFTATSPTIGVPLSESLVATNGAPLFSSATLAGSVLVDFGSFAVPARGTKVVVATFASAAPSPAAWRTKGISGDFSATLMVSGSAVVADIHRTGFAIRLK